MTTRYDCALNNIALSSLDGRICVTDVTECAPKIRFAAASRPGAGMHLLRRSRESLDVQVRLLIHESRIVQRRSIMQRILAWAEDGGWLTTCDRPGQRLRVVCRQTPAMSALEWLQELTLTFTALCPPCWEAADPVTAATAAEAELTVPGTATSCPVDASVLNQGGDVLTTLTLTAAETSMTFDGLSVPAGAEVHILWENGCLRAFTEAGSILLHRTADSHDLLQAPCGIAFSVSVLADQPVLATFSARGRYL